MPENIIFRDTVCLMNDLQTGLPVYLFTCLFLEQHTFQESPHVKGLRNQLDFKSVFKGSSVHHYNWYGVCSGGKARGALVMTLF